VTHSSQKTLGLLDGSVASQETDYHHHCADGDEDVDTWTERQTRCGWTGQCPVASHEPAGNTRADGNAAVKAGVLDKSSKPLCFSETNTVTQPLQEWKPLKGFQATKRL